MTTWPRLPRWLLALAVVAACWTSAAVGRPAANATGRRDGTLFDKPPSNRSSFPDADKLCVQLNNMTNKMLSELQASLSNLTLDGDVTGSDDDMMMGDMPSSDSAETGDAGDIGDVEDDGPRPQQLSSPSPAAAQATEPPWGGFNLSADEMARLAERESADCAVTEDRTKNARIKAIQEQILVFMNRSSQTSLSGQISKAHSSSPATSIQQSDAVKNFLASVKNLPSFPVDMMYTEKTQSFFPICYVPKNANEEENWNSKKTMNLMFSINLPKAHNDVSVNINMTKLRLFKHFVSCNSQTSNETDDSQICQPISPKKTTKLVNSSAEATSTVEDKQIRVSVYIRLVRKKATIKRRLLDSRMIPYYSEKWTEWNIHKALKTWRNTSHNFTLSVEVEDEDGNFLPVTRFFKPLNCTGHEQSTTPKPIPGFLIEAVHKGLLNNEPNASNKPFSPQQALSLNIPRYPIIDVMTIEVPVADTQNSMLLFDQNSAATAGKSLPTRLPGKQTEQHKIRHSNNRHKTPSSMESTETSPPPVDFSKVGEDLRGRVVNKIVLHRNIKETNAETPPSGWSSSSVPPPAATLTTTRLT